MKVFTGKVVSTKMQKTAVVEVERFFAHPLYEKRVRRTKRYPVHDEVGVKEGETVRFAETRPMSKTKRWKIVEVVGKTEKKVTRDSLTRNSVEKRVASKRGNKLPKEAK